MDKEEISKEEQKQAQILQNSITNHFFTIEDPRRTGSIRHKLFDILFITICAITCGANNLKAVAEYGKSKKEWLCDLLHLENGVPSYNIIWLLFMLLRPEALQECFANWMKDMAKLLKGKVTAIDGKAQRGTAKSETPNSFVHIVSAWASHNQLTLGQVKVDGKSNEITAIPKLLKMINVEDSIVTIDAMGCQKDIAAEIRNQGADYILALKGNQGSLCDEIENLFEQVKTHGEEGFDYDRYEEYEENNGREESRTVYATNDLDFLPQKDDWKDLQSVICVYSERSVKGKKSSENRYYISSLPPSAKELASHIRSHWGIESAHWTLDVAFREDEQRAKAGHISENLSLLRRISLNCLKQDKTVKAGIEIKRQKAGWDNNYLLQLLNVKSFS